MGTLREERVAEAAFERERQRLAFERQQREFTSETDVLCARIEALQRELQARQEEMALAQQEYAAHEQQIGKQRNIRRSLRGGDIPGAPADEGGEQHGAAPAE